MTDRWLKTINELSLVAYRVARPLVPSWRKDASDMASGNSVDWVSRVWDHVRGNTEPSALLGDSIDYGRIRKKVDENYFNLLVKCASKLTAEDFENILNEVLTK
jgi:hypothetical protein